jgi:cell wall-associated NlpC family hydrolase
MIFTNRYITLMASLLSLAVLVTSCSPSTNARRTGKYSTANKREKTSPSSKEDRKYTYHKSTTSENKKSKPVNNAVFREEIVHSAIQYKGTNYRSGGKSPETGFDCSGFTGYIFTQHGIPISGSSDKLAKLGKQKDKESLLPGDLVFFGNKDRISHVAIVASHSSEEMEVVHSTTSAGVKIDNITYSEYWQSRFLFGVDIISK